MGRQQPLFQEAARCDVCKCSFTTFRLRHHCWCCGRTLCSEHLSDQTNILIIAGIACFILGVLTLYFLFLSYARYGDHVAKPSINGADQIADSVAGLDICPEAAPAVELVVQGNPKCECGMPCHCVSVKFQWKNDPIYSQPSTKPKKIDTVAKTRPSSTSNRNSSMSNSGQAANGTSGKPKMDFDVNGEVAAVACYNYVLAASDIAFIPIDHGACLDYRNAQGKMLPDCAPATLQYKVHQKIGQGNQSDLHHAPFPQDSILAPT